MSDENLSLSELNKEIRELLNALNEQVSIKIRIEDTYEETTCIRYAYRCYLRYSQELDSARAKCMSKYCELMASPELLKAQLDAMYSELKSKWPYIGPEQWPISPPFILEIPKEPKLGFRQTGIARIMALGCAHALRNITMPYRSSYKMSRRAAIGKIEDLKKEWALIQAAPRPDERVLEEVLADKVSWQQKLEALKEEIDFKKKYPDSFGNYHEYCLEARKYFKSTYKGISMTQFERDHRGHILNRTSEKVWPGSPSGVEPNVFAANFFNPNQELTIEPDDSPYNSLYGEEPDSVFQRASVTRALYGRLSEASSAKTPLTTSSHEDALRMKHNRISIVDQSTLGQTRA